MTGLVLVALVVSLGGWWWARREVRAMRRDVARLQEDMRRATSLEEVYRAERGSVPPSRFLRRVKVFAPMTVGAELVRRYPVPATAVAAMSVLGGAAVLLSEPDPGTQILPGRAGPAPAVAAPAWDGQPDRPEPDPEPDQHDPEPGPGPEREPEPTTKTAEPSPGEVAMAGDPEPVIDAEPEIEAGAELELPSETDVELPGVEATTTAVTVPTTTPVAEPEAKPELKLDQRCLVELDVDRLRLCV